MATSRERGMENALRYYNQLNQNNGYTIQLHTQLSPMTMEQEYAITDWDEDNVIRVIVANHLTLEELIPLVKLMQPDHPLIM